jgi:hypothetical protein
MAKGLSNPEWEVETQKVTEATVVLKFCHPHEFDHQDENAFSATGFICDAKKG